MNRRPHAKLTVAQVIEIRHLAHRVTQEEIGKRFGINTSCVNQIIHRVTWRWLKKGMAAAAAFLIVVLARSVAAVDYDTCDTGIQAVLSIYRAEDGGVPSQECAYPIEQMVAFQKVKGGYLIAPDPDLGWEVQYYTLAFLRTEAKLEARQKLSGNAVYIKPVTYGAIDGFSKTVFGFLPVPVPPGADAYRASIPPVDPRLARETAK